jgi:hypothetical protein
VLVTLDILEKKHGKKISRATFAIKKSRKKGKSEKKRNSRGEKKTTKKRETHLLGRVRVAGAHAPARSPLYYGTDGVQHY